MGVPVVAPLAKLGLIGGGGLRIHGLAPLLTAALVGKFSFSFGPLQERCADMVQALRLFLFRMSEIASGDGAAGGLRRRRALRLIYESLVHVRRSQSDEETLFALSIHTL